MIPVVEYPSPFVVGAHGRVGPPDEIGTFVQTAVPAVTVALLEAIGPTGQTREVTNGYVALCGADVFSTDTPVGYLDNPLQGDGSYTQTLYSYERWVRLRFSGTFNTLRNFRFWMDTDQPLPGWSFAFGSSATYVQPSNAASSIALHPLPMSDPGVPNMGGVSRQVGGPTFSDWLVIQAVVDTSVFAQSGPAFGYAPTPSRVGFNFGWIEN